MNYLDYRKLMIQKIAKKGIHKIDFLKRRTEKELEAIIRKHQLRPNQRTIKYAIKRLYKGASKK